ncbi:hypothetical protein Hanom_Chr12g01113321 [Helianthus anomalus]
MIYINEYKIACVSNKFAFTFKKTLLLLVIFISRNLFPLVFFFRSIITDVIFKVIFLFIVFTLIVFVSHTIFNLDTLHLLFSLFTLLFGFKLLTNPNVMTFYIAYTTCP